LNFLVIFAVFLCAFAFSLVLNVILLRFSRNLGMHGQSKEEGVIRWASTSKPTIGGISFFLCFILSALVFFMMQVPQVEFTREFIGLLISVTLGFFIGLQDDAYDTKPLLKFLGQVSCGVVMIGFGVHIQLFHIPAIDYVITLFWVVGIMNSINLLDNMDAVTGTVSAMILLSVSMLIILYPDS
jgi:UDP-GlcNAc:undecaprenyl-phosphate/decaprenyl-phosphate GlcNAc-1-phosphate transferase